eukprot:3597361-Amphidinium_carterae.1
MRTLAKRLVEDAASIVKQSQCRTELDVSQCDILMHVPTLTCAQQCHTTSGCASKYGALAPPRLPAGLLVWANGDTSEKGHCRRSLHKPTTPCANPSRK